MGQWEPLADRIPVDVRRLATQLRRMKDRSGLTVPALAARTAQSAGTWESALAGRRLPPLDAVEVLAQASGADYDRIDALWKLAEKAAAGQGDRVPGRPVPYPDPLDPLGAEDGLPRRGRRVLLLAVVGTLAAAALVAVLLTAGPSTGRAPAGSTPSAAVAAPGAPARTAGAG
ncbi:Helix-turn-helix domain-containing protein, partial [Streptomyces sp. DvalAA-14]